jgi:glycosyltransferase involved in cell wall biosynthesis
MEGDSVPETSAHRPSLAGDPARGLPRALAQEVNPLTVGAVRACVIVPAFDAAASIRGVIDDLAAELGCDRRAILVVDDGSTDDTARQACEAGAHVVRCPRNRGKGAALALGLREARALGFGVAVTVDADGQHPARSAAEVLGASNDPRDLVLGVRDLARDGAPGKNRFSNRISNFFLSLFSGRRLEDTQCGLRRYPVIETLALRPRAAGYGFEAEIILRAIAAGIPVVERAVRVVYPKESERVTHFDAVRDPARIIVAVLRALHDLRRRR